MKNIKYSILASAISFIAWADTIKVTNNTPDQLEVGVVQAKGRDKELIKTADAKASVDFQIVGAGKTVSVKRQGYKYGIDRYLIVRDTTPGFTLNSQVLKSQGFKEGLYGKGYISLVELTDTYQRGFAVANAGYANGFKFTISGGQGQAHNKKPYTIE